jgi:hypothetical protein
MALKSFSEFFKIAKKVAEENAVNYQRGMATEVGGELAILNPVDTGRSTANWQGSINSPILTPIKKYDKSASATPTKRAIKKALSGSKKGDVLFVSNAVQGEDENGAFTGKGYIQFLDNGGSPQARYGMTGPTLARLKQISRKVLK